MRIAGIWLVVLTTVLTVPAAAQQPASASDRAYQLVGTWSCSSAAGSLGTSTFRRNGDGSLSLTLVYRFENGRTGEFDDTYRFDAKADRWTWTSMQRTPPRLLETGTAGPWTSTVWTFEGNSFVTVIPRPGEIIAPRLRESDLRMIYTYISDSAYQRDFEQYVKGKWITSSSSNCIRVSTAAAAAQPAAR